MGQEIIYADLGVDYKKLDPFKQLAIRTAAKTSGNLPPGFSFLEWTRGESAQLIGTPWGIYLGHVEEGLGTKSLAADAFADAAGPSYYDWIAQCTVAMIVNDMATLGVQPLTVAMHVAANDARWFTRTDRAQDLVHGWRKACDIAGCAWSGGETPALPGIVEPGTVLLSGSATGFVTPERLLQPSRIRDGDAIVLLESTGIHANGLSIARELAKTLPEGYDTRISRDLSYGAALLAPTHIYVPAVRRCLDAGIDLHYAVHISGHGWSKLIRAPRAFTYRIDRVPDVPDVLRFIQRTNQMDDRRAYGTFNMGAGYALYVGAQDLDRTLALLNDSADPLPYRAMHAGEIQAGERRVVIGPIGVTFEADTLQIR